MILVERTTTILVQIIIVTVVEISIVEISQETVVPIVSPLEIGAKIMAILVETKEIEAEVEVGLTPAQMSEGQR